MSTNEIKRKLTRTDLDKYNFDDFIEIAYNVLLGRKPDYIGKEYYKSREELGSSRESILYDIFMSKEHRVTAGHIALFFHVIAKQFLLRELKTLFGFIRINNEPVETNESLEKPSVQHLRSDVARDLPIGFIHDEKTMAYSSKHYVESFGAQIYDNLDDKQVLQKTDFLSLEDNNVPVIYLDIKDIINYVEGGNTTVSGIQRVVASIFLNRHTSKHLIIPVIPEYDNGRILSPSIETVDSLLHELQSGAFNILHLKSILAGIYDSRREVFPGKFDVFFLAGAFWIIDNYDIFMDMRMRNVSIVLFVHDLIQINNPEYVSEHANLTFKRSFLDILQVCDRIITNSFFVADDVRNFQLSNFSYAVKTEAVQLATQLPTLAHKNDIIFREELSSLMSCMFVLYVGTIEIRKNHIYLVKIWERLLLEGYDMPKLVFAGKWGWKIDDLKEYLEINNFLDGNVIVLNDLADKEISSLYENCIFTAYTSYAEGFGLPIGESLSHGKFCVSSSTTSMPEVGGDFCVYVDPFNFDDGYSKIKDLISDKTLIDKKTEYVKNNYRPKSWSSFCGEIYQILDDQLSCTSGQMVNFSFPSGKLYSFGYESGDVYEKDIVPSIRMARYGGWESPSEVGSIASRKVSSLKIPTKDKNTDVEIYLLLCSTEKGGVVVSVQVNGNKSIIFVQSELKAFKIYSHIGDDGLINIDFFITPKSNNDELPGSFLLSKIGWSEKTDYCGKLCLVESIMASAIIGKSCNQNRRELSYHSSADDGVGCDNIYCLLSYDGPQFIENVFQYILHRSCDEDGMINYLRKLVNGVSKAAIIIEVLKSEESKYKNKENKIERFLYQLDYINATI